MKYLLLHIIILLRALCGLQADELPIGLPTTIEVLLQYPDHQAAQPEIADDVHLEILSVAAEGDRWRYRLRVTPYIAGVIDLSSSLLRPDGTAFDTPIPITAVATRSPESWDLTSEPPAPAPQFGWYHWLLISLGLVWAILGLWLFLPRPKVTSAAQVAQSDPASELAKLAQQALAGKLSHNDKARLETLLINRWRHDLQLEGLELAEALAKIRTDQRAGPLLLQVEAWLHRPTTELSPQDSHKLNELLAPYYNTEPKTEAPQ